MKVLPPSLALAVKAVAGAGLFWIIVPPPNPRRCYMAQGAPVLAGMSNTATLTTEID
jgi:hypothetical protein